MDNKESLEYNLSKISDIDKEIEDNNKKKNKFIEHNEKKYEKCLFFESLLTRRFQAIFILIVTITVYISVINPLYSILISLNVVSFVNLLINMFISIYEIDESYSEKLEEYNKKNEELLVKRNSYINLYNYCMYGEDALYNNLRLRINNENFFEYDKCISNLDMDKDSYEICTLTKMQHEEEILRRSIKNKVYWELNSPVKTESLTTEQLKSIDLAL